MKVKKIHLLGGSDLTWKKEKEILKINLPETLPNPWDNVIVLELNKPAEDVETIKR